MRSKKMLQYYEKILTFFDLLTIAVLAFEIITITINVILRYVFFSSLAWLDEFASYGLVWLVFASSVRLMEEYGHFHTDVLIMRIRNTKVRKSIYLFNYVLMILYFAIVGYYGIMLCYSVRLVHAQSIPISKSLIHIIIPISSLLAAAILIKKAIKQEGD